MVLDEILEKIMLFIGAMFLFFSILNPIFFILFAMFIVLIFYWDKKRKSK